MATKDKTKTKEVRVLDFSGDEPLKKKKKKKKSAEVAETKVKLPKKLSKERALALADSTPKRFSKLDTKGMTSILGDAAEEIQQMLEKNNSDSAIQLLQKRMLQTVVDLIPFAEQNVRESKGVRGVYQINSLITSVRELMIDMQSTRDKGALGDTLVEKIIRPTFLDLGMEMVLENERVMKAIRGEVGNEVYQRLKKSHEESLARLAKFVQVKYGEAKQGTIAFMQQ